MLSLRLLVVFAPLVAMVAGAPTRAEACQPDPCTQSNTWSQFEVVSTELATDGVLRIAAQRNYGDAPVQDALAYAELLVVDPQGNAVAGALEYVAAVQSYVWRSAAPLSPGVTYDATLSVDNEALALALDEEWIAEKGCAENIDAALSFDVGLDPLPALLAPEPESSFEHDVDSVLSLSSMVCCDGAYPYEEIGDCSADPEPTWTRGHCAAGSAFGWVDATQSIEAANLDPAVRDDLALRLVQTDGNQIRHGQPGSLSLSMRNPEPFCAQLEVTSLATGDSILGPEHCYGAELADTLGVHAIDPTPELAVCSGQPYTCEPTVDAWDPKSCEAWGDPPGEDESGDDVSDHGPTDGDSGGTTGDGGDDTVGVGTFGDEGGSGSAGQDGVNDRGCACRSGRSDSSPAALWLLVLGAAWRGSARRRRCD